MLEGVEGCANRDESSGSLGSVRWQSSTGEIDRNPAGFWSNVRVAERIGTTGCGVAVPKPGGL